MLPAAEFPPSSWAQRWESWRWSGSMMIKGATMALRAPKPGSLAERPSHVRPEQVVDFDFNAFPGSSDDIHLAWKRLHEGPDIFWTPRNGGHWVVTRADDIEAILKDPERFSSSDVVIPRDSKPLKLLPLEADAPAHKGYRGLINLSFTPKVVVGLEQEARQLAIDLIEGFRARGRCEFVADFAKRLPIVMFLRLVDLPLDDRERLLRWTEASTRAPHAWTRMQAFFGMNGYIEKWIARRRGQAGSDLFSLVVNGKIDGKPLDHDEVQGMLSVILFGGLDTVAGMLAFTAKFLAQNPGHQRQLRDNPTLIPRAVEEFLRRHGVPNIARLVMQDMEFQGANFKQGDLVELPAALSGLDERRFKDPLAVDFERANVNSHLAFGSGTHRCVGALLARMEIRVFLEEWLKRIPEFQIEAGKKPRTVSGMVNGVSDLPLSWPI